MLVENFTSFLIENFLGAILALIAAVQSHTNQN
jgi:hypothetical protein